MPTADAQVQLLSDHETVSRDRLDALSGWFLGLAIFFPLLLVYVATGNINPLAQSPDPVAAALPAWHFAAFHSFYLDHVLTTNPWVYTTHGHTVSNRQPGIVMFAVPFYLLLDHTSHFNMFPAVVAAATAAAGAVSFVVLALRRALGTRLALLAGGVLAFGTATWSVSADSLWPHGPDQLFLAMAMFFLSRNRRLPAAVAIALCIPIRAHLAVLALVAGVWFAIRDRSVKPVLIFGIPAAIGIAALVTYNNAMFGTWSLNGGYPPYATTNLEGLGQLTNRASLPMNILGSLFSLDRGVIVWCPLVLVLTIGLRAAWRESPDWVKICAVGGLLYLLIQLKLNYFTGGDRFWSYRLTIETLTLLVPLFAYAARDVIARRPVVRRLALAAALYGVGAQAVGAIFFSPDDLIYNPWWHSKLAQELVHGGNGPRVVMGITTLAVLAALFWPRRRPAPDALEPQAAPLDATPALVD